MKKILFVFTLMCTMLLSSCNSLAQFMADEYYDYNTNTIIIYQNNIPYYRIWDVFLNDWRYDLVPYDRIPYIRHRRVPMYRPHYQPQPQPRPHVGGGQSSNRGSIGGGFDRRGSIGGSTSRGSSSNMGGQPSRGGSPSMGGGSPRGSIGGGFSGGHSQGGRR